MLIVPIDVAVIVVLRLNAIDVMHREFFVKDRGDGTGTVHYMMGGKDLSKLVQSVFIDARGETVWDDLYRKEREK